MLNGKQASARESKRVESNRIDPALPLGSTEDFVANRLTPFNYYAPITRENRCRARAFCGLILTSSAIFLPTASTSFHYQSGSIGALPSRKTRAIFLEWANRISFVDFDGCHCLTAVVRFLAGIFSLLPPMMRAFSRISGLLCVSFCSSALIVWLCWLEG